MKFNIKISILLAVLLQSCWGDKGAPNYEYMPNMYESLSYETYTENEIFEDKDKYWMLFTRHISKINNR